MICIGTGSAVTADPSAEEIAALFGLEAEQAEADGEVAVDFAKLPWHVFFADPRVRLRTSTAA